MLNKAYNEGITPIVLSNVSMRYVYTMYVDISLHFPMPATLHTVIILRA